VSLRVAASAACIAALAGCGYVGDPQPPSLDIPIPVSDLRAWEYGEQIVVAFTLPSDTTEGLTLHSFSGVELAIGGQSFSVPASKPGPVEHEVAARQFAGQTVEIRVRATGPKGKQSSWSNLAALEVIEPLATPVRVRAENVARGVAVRWQGSGPKYRVYRAAADEPPQPIGDSDTTEYLDETTIYGIRYQYLVQALASDTQQGALAAAAAIIPEDVFAPSVPAGLTGLATVQSVELAWERNTEDDFASYNIFRSLEDGPLQQIATKVESPAFSDTGVEPGKRYRYAVSAVDMKGNESARSEIIEVTVQ
jgi:hypothetical protein